MRLGRVFRRTGRAILKAQREASKLNEGLDEILGEQRTRPSDGFSQDRTRQRASMGRNQKNRMRSRLGNTAKGSDKDFDLSFGKGKKSGEEDEDRRFF